MGIVNILFILLLIATILLFTYNVKKIANNIHLGKDTDRKDQSARRWKLMTLVAIGQSKMTVRPVAAIMHLFVYVGFIIINVEFLEILIDGIFNTHRFFSTYLGSLYAVMVGVFEILAFLVLLGCLVFLIRRNVLKIKRFWSKEMTSWPRTDANTILITEILLMSAFLIMNSAEGLLAQQGFSHYAHSGLQLSDFPLGVYISTLLSEDVMSLQMIERFCWWFHIIGVFAFLNYLPYSKHFHVLLAFPNVYYSNLNPKGQLDNMESVTKEVQLMLDPNADPYATPAEDAPPPERFGIKDVRDMTWKQLMDSYTCTECGRCTSVCPANLTGKILSPRKVVMDTRDRLEEVGKNIKKKGMDFDDGKSLMHQYISPEEVWACTTCNACTEACPVNIEPLSIILGLRRYLVMEEAKASPELNTTFTNIENNGAPWAFAQADRLNWATE